ncbi:hypothetical protein PoB_006837000 [Plakobranchus ocellatus]|uniref:Uncharacterized protein n=1 Tax=Plakobranchus ocellatus TaxID=259542 RepID=A0AAV4DD24_9GAST|nr:hypothetical protein PoB_006837000 [Plakobranchus ocellatus]
MGILKGVEQTWRGAVSYGPAGGRRWTACWMTPRVVLHGCSRRFYDTLFHPASAVEVLPPLTVALFGSLSALEELRQLRESVEELTAQLGAVFNHPKEDCSYVLLDCGELGGIKVPDWSDINLQEALLGSPGNMKRAAEVLYVFIRRAMY